MIQINNTKSGEILWFTGLSGSGKSTLAEKMHKHLEKKNNKCLIIDGDIIRSNPNHKVDFTVSGINNNHKYARFICTEKIKIYDFLLVTVISPFKTIRKDTRKLFGNRYKEIYVKSSLEKVIERDVKGLYRKALKKELEFMIGIDPRVPYEIPKNPEIIVDTENMSVKASSDYLISELQRKNICR